MIKSLVLGCIPNNIENFKSLAIIAVRYVSWSSFVGCFVNFCIF
jgi:hypothetical protein